MRSSLALVALCVLAAHALPSDGAAESSLVEVAADAKPAHDELAFAVSWDNAKTTGVKPMARKGHSATVVGNKMFVYGGSAEPEHKCFDDLFVLDLDSNVWSKPDMVSTRPPALMGHTATHVTVTEADGSAGDYIFVLGGFTFSLASGKAESTSWVNDLWILNVKTLTWSKAEFSGTPMTPRQGHSATLVKTANGDPRIFVYGGYTESGMADSSLLALKTVPDAATGQYKWTEVAVDGAKPAARQGHAAALLSQRYYVVVGGYQGEGGQSLMDVHVVDTASASAEGKLKWQAITTRGPENRPSPREDMATAVLPGRTELMVVGGCAYPSGECYNDVRVLAVEDGDWTWLPTKVVESDRVMSPREELTAVVVPREDVDGTETRVLVFGGGKKDEETFSDLTAIVMEAKNTKCQQGCSGHGTCNLGDCDCDEGFFGAVCSRFCPNNCNGHGTCKQGVCTCADGWKGEGCDEQLCPKNCNGNGKCGSDGKCACHDNFHGAACDKTCDPKCGEHGKCTKDLECACEKGWQGDTCTEAIHCPDDCSGHGTCDSESGKCACEEGFTGAACSKEAKKRCKDDCSGHGTCKDDTTCECAHGYEGETCAVKIEHVEKSCPNQCSGHGTCNADFTCKCVESHGKVFYGVDCSQSSMRTVKLPMEKGPCTPDGFLTVPADDQSYTTLTIEVMGDAGIPEQVPCPVASSSEVKLTTPYTYRPEGSDTDVTVSVPLRRVGNRLLMVRPDAPKTKVEVSVPKAAVGMKIPDVPALKSLSTGDVIILSPGTDTEEEAIVKSVGGEGVAGADSLRFRSGAMLAAADAGGEEVEFTAPLKFAHPSPVTLSRASPATPPQSLPSSPPAPEPVKCPGCSTEGGHCVKNEDGEGECKCFTGFSGANCDVIVCPKNCTNSDQGTCAKNKDGEFSCKCKFGYSGLDCSGFTGCGDLGRGCGEHGDCREKTETMTKGGVAKTHTFGFCDCHTGWRGPLSNIPACPNNCTANVVAPEKPHGECVSDGRKMACACNIGWQGEACATPDPCPKGCSGHGKCSSDDPNEVGRHCVCADGWSGDICAHPEPVGVDPCPLDCSDHGACHHGTCACHRGWAGTACNEPIPCVRNCSGNGKCDGGICQCFKGWTGEDCSALRRCKNECSSRGRCVLGECVCAKGWTGEDCATEAACPEDCSGHGACKNGLCECGPSWSGDDCSIHHAVDCEPHDCSGNGQCHLGKCYCNPGFEGTGCADEKKCPTGPSNDGSQADATCRGNGVCKYGKCFCAPGYEGEDCHDAEDCPTSSDTGLVCSGHGFCDGAKGKCFCAAGYDGAACERGAECPKDCSSNGFCFNGKCQCDIGFTGASCDTPVTCPGTSDSAPDGCNGHGNCLRGKCYCAPGFTGEDCGTEATCPSNCDDHGRCSGGLCMCDPGFKGEDCSETVTCPDKCNGRGVCMLGTCVCHEGFAGKSCQLAMPCPDDCSGHGDCMQGKCICDGGYTGISCGSGSGIGHKCPNNCTGHGECHDGKCTCNPGWRGRSCRHELPCPANCSGNGQCAHGACFCDPGWTGRSCHLTVPCPADCSGHGKCSRGQCFCADGFTGEDCATNSAVSLRLNALQSAECPKGLENLECSNHGRCESGQCQCESGWFGADCSSATTAGVCPNRCSGHGVCTDGKCQCVPGWAGEDCSRVPLHDLRARAEACASSCEHGSCSTGSCVCEDNWTGAACDEPICPDSCTLNPDGTANGLCTSGRCICNAGFAGPSCSLSCPSKCSGHGTCQTPLGVQDPNKAHCYCSPGWGGDDCSKVMVKKEGMQMNALLAVALITFVVGLCAIPLVRTYQARRAMKMRRNIIFGPQGLDDEEVTNPLSAHVGGPGSA